LRETQLSIIARPLAIKKTLSADKSRQTTTRGRFAAEIGGCEKGRTPLIAARKRVNPEENDEKRGKRPVFLGIRTEGECLSCHFGHCPSIAKSVMMSSFLPPVHRELHKN
jgi:hypothetical protein